ncbi:Disulfide bond formation protein C [Meiothermus luteus]|jgi:disulfide bond formation protein DsbB|uniref:Disulfide bond formation protein C n=1 Tax=Meiothermus luteus TaxID=2026184 RepID=A0A399EY00_9DEIN|nr:disulfide bond formation protein B [Meiothermus luteus]RIH89487.1 Disulfide bond formation protein C [Meiothermus luteus]RMH54315.1 MAG: disulfide bond formation protein B [Deinococcota bacterium]
MTPVRNLNPSERNTLLLALAWLVALVATLGSLYYSEVRNFIPCTLCWYQRIAMYPLALLLGIALWRGDAGVKPYAITLSLLGLFWSSYHLLELWVPGLAPNVCKGPIPCNVEYLPQFPIPLQAWLAFALITLALLGVSPRRD